MEGRRDRGWLAEGSDAPAGALVQCHLPEGAGGIAGGRAAALLLGLGSDAAREREWLLSLYARDEPSVWAARGPRHAGGRGPGERLPAPCAPRRGDAPGGARLGPGSELCRRARAFVFA